MQEHFVTCSDIRIKGNGNENDDGDGNDDGGGNGGEEGKIIIDLLNIPLHLHFEVIEIPLPIVWNYFRTMPEDTQICIQRWKMVLQHKQRLQG